MAISISLPNFLVNGEFGDFTVTKESQRVPVPVGTVNTLEISGDAVKGEGLSARDDLNTRATVVILKQHGFLEKFLHGVNLTLFSVMSNSFYVTHALWETDSAVEDGQVVFTDTTGFVATVSGLVTVTTVKVIVLRLTANVAEKLIGIPFGHKIGGVMSRYRNSLPARQGNRWQFYGGRPLHHSIQKFAGRLSSSLYRWYHPKFPF